MSTSLTWSPVPDPATRPRLSYELKKALGARAGGSVDTVMSVESLPYLEGLMDAGIDDATILIQAIHMHGNIRVKEI